MGTGKLWAMQMEKLIGKSRKDFINNIKNYYTPDGLKELDKKLDSLIVLDLSSNDGSPIDKFKRYGKLEDVDEKLQSFFGGLEVMLESLKNKDNKRARAGYELAFNAGVENPNSRNNVSYLCDVIIPGCKCTGFAGVVKGEVAKEFKRMDTLDKHNDSEIIAILNKHIYEPIAKEELKNGHEVKCTIESEFGVNLKGENTIDNFYGDRDKLLEDMGKLNSSIKTDAQDLEEERKAVQMEA